MFWMRKSFVFQSQRGEMLTGKWYKVEIGSMLGFRGLRRKGMIARRVERTRMLPRRLSPKK